MTKFLPIVFSLLSTVILVAQRPNNPTRSAPKIKLTGTVVDNNTGKPLPYATLILKNTEVPEKINGGITDENGVFEIESLPGTFDVRIEYISYVPIELKAQTYAKNTSLGRLTMAIDVAQLEEVEVVGERTTVEIRLDKKVYNIGKDLTASGATISDALNNIPSVDVDVEGAISLRGNENVRILINGKPSALAGFGSTDALQQLPADAIEKVEVITSPSARYDAEGTAGILNIVLKQEKTKGFNGSVNTFIGYPVNSGVTLNTNLRTNKINWFSTIGYRFNTPPGNATFDNTYVNGDFDRLIENREYDRENQNFNINIGAEFLIGKSSSITPSFFYQHNTGNDVSTTTNDRFIGGSFNSATFRTQDENEDEENYQVSLNFTNKFNEDGHELSADFQYGENEETINTDIEENLVNPSSNLLVFEKVFTNEASEDVLVQMDYVLPVGDSQFEAGFRGDYEEEITQYQLDSLNQATGQLVTNTDLTNTFVFNQNITAGYLQYGNKFGKLSFLLGVRLENTQLKGEVTSEFDITGFEEFLGDIDVNFDKNFLGLFPTVNLILEVAENENFSLGYNRRINRPRSWFINPFPSRSSRTNVFQGNPGLNPVFANAVDVGYLKRWDKLTLNASVYYQRETDSFEWVRQATDSITVDGLQIVRSTPINLSENQRYGGEASFLYNPSKKLRINGSINFFRFESEGTFEGQDYGAKNTSFIARLSKKLTLPGKVNWQTNAFYRGPRKNAQIDFESILSVSMAISKDLFDDKATISINGSDIFNSRKRRSFTQTPEFTSDSEFQWREPQFTLSFLYRFNQSKADREKERRNQRRGGGDFQFEGGGGASSP